MSQPVSQFNPFQAPEVQQEPEVRMLDDVEFLISSKTILCRDQVTLPKVCIHTGDNEDLVARHQTLVAASNKPLAFVFCFFITIQVSQSVPRNVVVFGVPGWLFAMIPLGLLALLGLLIFGLRLFPKVRVQATWYVSQRYLNRVSRERVICHWLLIPLCGGMALFTGITCELPPLTSLLLTLVAAVAAFIGCLMVDLERSLRVRKRIKFGIHKGLMVLDGHSQKFADAVHRIVQHTF